VVLVILLLNFQMRMEINEIYHPYDEIKLKKNLLLLKNVLPIHNVYQINVFGNCCIFNDETQVVHCDDIYSPPLLFKERSSYMYRSKACIDNCKIDIFL